MRLLRIAGQKTIGYRLLASYRIADHREGVRADCFALALPIGPVSMLKFQVRAGTRRVSLAPSRLVPKLRVDAAKRFILPGEKRERLSLVIRHFPGALVLAQAGPGAARFLKNRVPFCRIPGTVEFYPKPARSTSRFCGLT